MSRYTKELENGNTVAFGFDSALGYFIDEFGPDNDGEDALVLSESSLLTGMGNGKMVELMKKYELPEAHIERVVMDLPI